MQKVIKLRHAVIDPQFANALHAFALLRANQPAAAFDASGRIQKPALMMRIGPAMMRIEQMPCYGKFDIQYKTLTLECDALGNPLPNEEYNSLMKTGWQDMSNPSGTADINQITSAALHTIGNSPHWEEEYEEYKSILKQMAKTMNIVNRPRIGCCLIFILLSAIVAVAGTAIAKCL